MCLHPPRGRQSLDPVYKLDDAKSFDVDWFDGRPKRSTNERLA
jgi:hypothetical protein